MEPVQSREAYEARNAELDRRIRSMKHEMPR